MKPTLSHLLLSTIVLLGARFPCLSQAPEAIQGRAEISTTTNPNVSNSPLTAKPNLSIGPGDLLQVNVLGAPDFDRQVRVSGDGSLVLPLVGNLQVGGMTIREAEESIAQRLGQGGFFNNPSVSVLVKEYVAQGISVLGEVRKPGIYEMLGTRTLLDALSVAGGTTDKSGKWVTITHRDRPDSPETMELLPSDSAAQKNAELRPGDIVVVSKAGVVYVVGAVRQPTEIVLVNPSLTVLQAIAIAQGTNPTAALDKTRLIRRSPAGQQEINIPLKQILEAKSADIPLLPDDVVFVPNSAAKSAAVRSLEAVLQAATGIVIYRR